MSWIELDDGILDHPKFIRAVRLGGSQVVHLWLGLRAYCAKNLTNGIIPEDMLDEVRGPRGEEREAALKILVTVGLLERKDESGPVKMHNYLKWSSSRAEVLERREKARERKAKSRTPSQRDTPRDGQRDSERSSAAVTNPSSPPLPTSPLREEDPPSVTEIRPRDPLLDSLTGKSPKQRPDVLALHARWKSVFGQPEARLDIGMFNTDADILAECLNAHGVELCNMVCDFAPNDGMVSGRDDERRQPHPSIAYIFGNQNAFLRILKAAKAAKQVEGISPAEKIRRAGELR